ncbi:MAG: hypothetical protein KatS3mg027_1794 [Bacteroidia bacterium]|nr:MAG: hypothetical protein KatS3mg027_1794 [Bacteroidia bacterium]
MNWCFDLYKPEKEHVMHLVKEKMEGAFNIGVPLITEMNTGENWLEAH